MPWITIPSDREREKHMMTHDLEWSQMLLPLKRMRQEGHHYEFGYLVDPEPIVRLGGIFAAKEDDERIEYSSWDDLIDDGWVVD